MHICMIAGHACVRVQKMAIPLIGKGHHVHLMAKAMPSAHEYYETFSYCVGIGQYLDAIKKYANSVDIFHCHNEPSWFVTAVKEHCDVPVILDIHDSNVARITVEQQEQEQEAGLNTHRIYTEERNNFQLADGLVFPGEAFRQIVVNEFGLNQPQIVLPSYVPRMLYQYTTGPWYGGLVYEGKVNLSSEVRNKGGRKAGFIYADYEELAHKAHEIGIQLHLYSTRRDDNFIKAYDDITFIHAPRTVDIMITDISRHDWGLVGNIHKTSEWDVAFPNKLFEYMAALLPIVVINAKECADFVLKYGIGIVVESIQELADRWGEHRECRKNLIKVRQKFSMENNIHILEGLYDQLARK